MKLYSRKCPACGETVLSNDMIGRFAKFRCSCGAIFQRPVKKR